MSYILQSKTGGDFKPHPEGIHPAVCVDVIDLGMVESEFQGQRRLVNKVRLAFESEQKNDEGKNCIITKTFTASLHPKAKLADFLGKWRGRPVVPGESIDLAKLVGANCTLVVSHQQSLTGRTYASIDAVSKPTKRVTPSGHYDPALARQRVAEWKAREAAAPRANSPAPNAAAPRGNAPASAVQNQTPVREANDPGWMHDSSPAPVQSAGTAKSAAPQAAQAGQQAPTPDFDPEVGF